MIKPAPQATLGEAVFEEFARGVKLLRHTVAHPDSTALARFQSAFVARYKDREVPLLEALDEECGIGFSTTSSDTFVRWKARDAWLLRRLNETIAAQAMEIALEPKEIETLGGEDAPPLADAFSVMVSVAAASPEALNEGRFQILLQSIMGPSGAGILGCFCYADDLLHQSVQRHLRAEEALEPRAIFAEIVHLPEPRAGNVLVRPILRHFEIPYLGCSGAPRQRQIPASDIGALTKA